MSHRFWFYLTLVLLPTQLGYHFWPQWAHLLGRRIDYLSPTIYLTDITIFITLVSWFWAIRRHPELSRIRRQILDASRHLSGLTRMTRIALVLSGIFIVLNITFSLSPWVTLTNWLRWLILALWGWYIVKSQPDYQKVGFFLSLSVIWSSLIAIFQWHRGQALGGIFWLLGERWYTSLTPALARANLCLWGSSCREVIRSYATFPHPNVLAGYLVTLWPILAFARRPKPWRRLALCLLPFALFTTLSRYPFLIWFTLNFFQLLRLLIHKKFSWSLLLLALVVVGGIIIFFPQISSLTLENESVHLRQVLNSSAWKIFLEAPLFGTGLGAFLVALAQIIPKTGVYIIQPVHSVPLLILSELGLIGVILLFFSISRLLPKFNYKSPLFLSLITFLLLGLVDHYPLTIEQGRLTLVLLISLLIKV